MAENSAIEWTDHTFNPWIGCTRVSAGCQRCYAEALAKRTGMVGWGPKADRHLTGPDNWSKPLKWQSKARKLGRRFRVFCASMADVFDDHPSIQPEWRRWLWALIFHTPDLDWLLLTKRPENWAFMLPTAEPGEAFAHVRLGVTIENQDAADQRGAIVQFASDIGWKTMISYEPALGSVNWAPFVSGRSIGWMISGDESGHHRRQADQNWHREARDAAAAAGAPYLFKQRVIGNDKISLPLLDGRQHVAFPESR